MDYSTFDDESLLRLILHRQEYALSELYDRYGRLVYSIALNALGEPAAAEEVTQDVFLRVWERAETYQSEQGKLINWLVRIARNRSIDLIRRRSVRPEATSIGWEEIGGADPASDQHVEQIVELNQQQRRVRWAVNQLPPEQAEALGLAYFHGLTQKEIAARLGQPLGTVKTRVRLGMLKLRTLLDE